MTFVVHFKFVGLTLLTVFIYASSETIYHHIMIIIIRAAVVVCFFFFFFLVLFCFYFYFCNFAICLPSFAALLLSLHMYFMRLPNAALGNRLPSPTFSNKEKTKKVQNYSMKFIKYVSLFAFF